MSSVSQSFLWLCLYISFVRAAEDQFIVSQLIDETPDPAPSVPAGLSAVAVSTSQIDLSWTASTNDTAVTDYRVFPRQQFCWIIWRVTTYSDSGLTPNTTYTYTVSAIDAATNESARSASSSATTFQIDQPPADDNNSSNGNGYQPIKLLYFTVSPDFNEAVISLGTDVPVRAIVWWGKTQDLELGSLPMICIERIMSFV